MVNAQFADARVARWKLDWLQSGGFGASRRVGSGSLRTIGRELTELFLAMRCDMHRLRSFM